jgi:hypothetical protein
MRAKVSYAKGMDMDASAVKRDPQSYFYAKNIRLLTDEGSSTGAIENEKGHILSFIIPTIPEMTLESGQVIPEQENLSIIGWCSSVDDIVVFTTNVDSDSPVNGYGQIWKFKYDEETNTIIGATGDTLDPAIHLHYNNLVNFSREYRIKSLVRYENSNTFRVYWTDNYNSVRVLNIATTDSLQIPVSNLSLIPAVDFSQPTYVALGNGNLRTNCNIQFSYRLIDPQGGVTNFAPLSVMIPLYEDSATSGSIEDFGATGSVNIKNRSVSYLINGVDTNYNVIEHIAVITDENEVVTVYKFDEEAIPSTGIINVTCDNLDEALVIPLTEFNNISSGFDVAKDIESYKNRLVAANLKTKSRIIDFDSRVYRFNAAGEALLQGTPNITLTTPAPDYDSIPKEHDAINIYNNEADANWYTTNQYKFQEDGVTLGGSGKYISYTFTTKQTIAYSGAETDITSYPPHLPVPRATSTIVDFNVFEADGTVKPIRQNTEFLDTTSAWAHGNYGSYARGETYRFAIVFYQQGVPSFANWIGDIRFPDVEDGFPLQEVVAGTTYVNHLGLEFSVDITSLSPDINGYSIVRVERGSEDETKVGSGLFMFFDIQESTNRNTLPHDVGITYPDLDSLTNINGASVTSIAHLSCKPGLRPPQRTAGSAKRFSYLLSPLGQLEDLNFRSGDYVRTRGYYEAMPTFYHPSSLSVTGAERVLFSYKCREFLPNTNFELFEVQRTVTAETGEYFPKTGAFVDDEFGLNNLMNASYSKEGLDTANNRVPLGMGSKKVFLKLADNSTIPHFSGDPGDAAGNTGNLQWYGTGDYDSLNVNAHSETGLFDTVAFKEVVYGRYLNNQYGGNTFADRSVNQYFSTGHYQTTANGTATVHTFEVFGGDIFVTYYDDEYIHQYWSENFANTYKNPSDFKVSVAAAFPVECKLNTSFQARSNWAKRRVYTNPGAYEKTNRAMSNAWKLKNKTEDKFFALDFLTTPIDEKPHMIWASEIKQDGELKDSWRNFKVANSTEVEGIYGPINVIKAFKDTFLFYQNQAMGAAAIEDRSLVQDSTGQQLVLGTGTVLSDYSYLSRETGTVHQFSVVASPNAVYHFDARLKKMYQFTGSLNPISDLKGLSSFFANEIEGSITVTDKTVRAIKPVGIHGEYDPRYNRVFFTFLNNKAALDLADYTEEIDGVEYISLPEGTAFQLEGITYYNYTEFYGTIGELSEKEDLFTYPQSFTISIDELYGCYRSFYDFVPGLYLNYGRRLLSANPFVTNEAYVHNKGIYCSYYGLQPVTHKITHFIGSEDNVKILNNLEFYNQVTLNNTDVPLETASKLRTYNDYQDTGVELLIAQDNIKRRMRTWHYTIPRDENDPTNPLARMRNPWFKIDMTFNNNNNKRFILHDLIYQFTPSRL